MVHKASSYKWDEILIDAEAKKTGAKLIEIILNGYILASYEQGKKVYLINHKNITPFKHTVFKDENTVNSSNTNIYFVANIKSESDVSNYSNLSKFTFPEDEFLSFDPGPTISTYRL